MICGNAVGELLPPFVVYKATQMWDIWTEGGPKNARYFSTKSGWFDAPAFNEWFESLLLPRLKKVTGKSVVIADNLSSHLNVTIFEKCRANDISFVCLPPNSTHITQPLDVAFFRPMKVAWRKVLSDWKGTPNGMNTGVLPKQAFPALLKKVLEDLEPNMKKNLESGFRKSGIYPCDVQPLLDRIGRKQVEPSAVSSAFLELVETARSACQKPVNVGRRKKINLPAGKSLSNEEILEKMLISSRKNEPSNETNLETQPGTSCCSRPPKRKKQRSHRCYEDSEDEFFSESELLHLNDSSDDDDWESFRKKEIEKMEEEKRKPAQPSIQSIKKEVGAFVVVSYQDDFYPGMIENLNDNGATVSAMVKTSKGNWKWPEIKDELYYYWEDIVGSINPPQKINRRGMFLVPELVQPKTKLYYVH